MYLLITGVVLLLLKYLEISPVVAWDWWIVLAPFGLAVAWWTYADQSGYSKRKAVEKMDARKQARIDRQRDAMGLPPKKTK